MRKMLLFVAVATTVGSAQRAAVAQPLNDNCADAIVIELGSTDFDTTGATTDGPEEPRCEFPGGNNQINQDIWYSFAPPAAGFYIVSTCNMASFDTRLAVYAQACPQGPDEAVGCNDDDPACLNFTSRLTFEADGLSTYLIRLGGFNEGEGPGTLRVSPAAERPPNDDCDDAIEVAINSFTGGSTLSATPDEAGECGTTVTAPGVWYSVVGNGHVVTAATCDEVVHYDTKINVYRDGCQTLTCVGGNDDACGEPARLSRVDFESQEGVTYLILVQGFDGQTGDFVLSVRSLGESRDCNENRVPDECDVDCDREGCDAWPECGVYPDCNGNHVPDECEGQRFGPYQIQPNVEIPDFDPEDPQVLLNTIKVRERGAIADLDAEVVISHAFIGDLTIDLEHRGVSVRLWDRQCGLEDDMGILFDDEGDPVICATPTVGRFQPVGALSDFDFGELRGDWTLTVADNALGDVGTLVSWSVSGTRDVDCDPCTGRQRITKTKCKTAEGQVKVVVVKVKRAVPDLEYTAVLDSGQTVVETAGPAGRVKFKFRRRHAPACGPNGVTVCDVHVAFDCSC